MLKMRGGSNDAGMDVAETADKLLERVAAYLPDTAIGLILDAYHFAGRSHDGQTRKSGEPYIAHPLENRHLPVRTAPGRTNHRRLAAPRCSRGLRGAAGRTFPPFRPRNRQAGRRRHQADPPGQPHPRPAETPSPAAPTTPIVSTPKASAKMLVSMAEDIRVVLIKLADRMHQYANFGRPAPGKAPPHFPGNSGYLFPTGPSPRHLGNQVAIGGYGLSPPGRR